MVVARARCSIATAFDVFWRAREGQRNCLWKLDFASLSVIRFRVPVAVATYECLVISMPDGVIKYTSQRS